MGCMVTFDVFLVAWPGFIAATCKFGLFVVFRLFVGRSCLYSATGIEVSLFSFAFPVANHVFRIVNGTVGCFALVLVLGFSVEDPARVPV